MPEKKRTETIEKEIKNDTALHGFLIFCNEDFCPILQNASHVVCKSMQIIVKITLKIIFFNQM